MPGPATDTTAVVHPNTSEGRVRLRHRRWFSWVTSLLLVAVIGSAAADGLDLVDAWGVDDATVSEAGRDGDVLTVRYPSVTRGALASPFEIVVERPGGFATDVELAIDAGYLALWDVNGVFPAPSSERSAAGGQVIWTFDPPDGDVLRVLYEARIEPAVQLETRRGSISLLDEAGQPAITVRFSTGVRP